MDTLIHTGTIMSLSHQSLKGSLEMRKYFDDIVLKRDGEGCHICRSDNKVHGLHISSDLPFGGYVVENGILLCSDCRKKAKDGVLTSDYLYSLIDSSRDVALTAYKRPKPQV